MFLILLGLGSHSLADFAQWDNFEIYLPWILSAHRRILHGEFPLWNQFQNLGEPLHAMGPGGVFYVPYTVCTWLIDALRWDPRSVMNAIAVTHVGFAGLGLYRLCRSFGARPLFAMIAGISGAMSGFGLIVGAVWIHILPTLAWSAWALWAAKELIDFHRPGRAAIVATLSLTMTFAVGHVQAAVYLWVVTGFFAIAYASMRRNLVARIPWLAAVGVAAALLSMPMVLPTAALLSDSNRSAAMLPEDFGARGVLPRALLGLLLPSYGGEDGFLETGSLSSTHCGAWLMPVLLAASVAWFFGQRNRRGRDASSDRTSGGGDLPGGLVLNGAMAAVIIALSLGSSAPFYGWTYGIPVWSSFRWPFKLFQHALPALMVAGAIGLEILARRRTHASRRFLFLGMALVALLLWISSPGLGTPSAIATGVFGLLAMVALAWLDAPWGRASLTLMVILGAAGMVFLTHGLDREPGARSVWWKAYAQEEVGGFGAKELSITTDFRLLPVSPSLPEGAFMQELGLFHSATLGRYYSLTGHRFALTSQRLWKYLPTEADGLLPDALLPALLQSHLMRIYNVRYVLAAKNDTPMVRFLHGLPGYRRIAETPRALIFANQDALPRFYFATEVHPFSDSSLAWSLVENRSPVTCALVEGALGRQGAVPHGRVERLIWGQERVATEVVAPEGGFLVVSMSFSPDWVARVDGRPAQIRITNGAIMGLEVPPGARSVVLTYEPPSFRRGLWLALLGLGVLSCTAVGLSLRTRSGAEATGSAS